MPSSETASIAATGRFRAVPLVLVVLILLLLISAAARWYAQRVSLPRYCAQPDQFLQRLSAVISEQRPAGNQSRREYIVAAKLRYLLPAQADESDAEYLRRLRVYLERQCG